MTNPYLQSFLELHTPSLRKQNGMVYEIWEDGEVTMQKSGSLYNQRSLHSMKDPFELSLPQNQFPPETYTGHLHACIAVEDNKVEMARQLLWDAIKHHYSIKFINPPCDLT